jgi:hypothetical protein
MPAMKTSIRSLARWVGACALLLTTSASQAVPIVYTPLTLGVTAFGTVGDIGPHSPVGASYYSFSASAGQIIRVDGDRLEEAYDMSLWIFSGLFGDTDEFDGGLFPALFDIDDAPFARFADDETEPFIPATPPDDYHGDPLEIFVAPVTGSYTIAVTNFFSGDPGTDGLFSFALTASRAAPEPTALALLGDGLLGVRLNRRKTA